MTATNIVSKWQSLGPRMQSVLRIVAAFMFMLAGTMKLFAFPAGVPPDGGTVHWMSQIGLGAALYCFVWLYFSAAGAGPWSLDARRR